jgi:hypothetical protein
MTIARETEERITPPLISEKKEKDDNYDCGNIYFYGH